MTERCTNCDAIIPEGGTFCIECGRPANQPATGATERLPEYAGGPRCAFCGTRNPPGAIFCVSCGQGLTARPVAEPPASALPPTPAPASLSNRPVSVPGARWGGLAQGPWAGITGGLFLIGLAVIAAFNWWWPGILVLVGLTAFVGSVASGKPRAGSIGGFWLIGLAVIAAFNWWWPGILVLVGLSAILGSVMRSRF